jgi:PAS domain S-box-containing protein
MLDMVGESGKAHPWLRLGVLARTLGAAANAAGAGLTSVLVEVSRRAFSDRRAQTDARFRDLMEVAPEPVGIIRAGRIVFANRAWAEMLGYPDAESVRGVQAASVLPDKELVVSRQREALLLASRKPLPRRVYRALRVDGTEVELEVTSVYCEYEGAPAVLSVARDVTARKTLERQLVQADRLAAIGTMTAGVAHEINNPLAYVLLNLDWVTRTLRSAASDPPSLEQLMTMLEDARHGVEHVARIVRELKSFSRGDTETLTAVDLQAVVESAIKIAGHEVRRRATLQTAFEPAPLVWANDARVEQVVVNLLINAAQAMTGNGAPAVIRVSVTPTDSDRVSLEVQDNGSGIPADVLPRIFDPFFTTKPIGVGTGLGLSICHGIVTSLGGTIAAYSEPGKGTTFRVTLPVAHPDDGLTPAPQRAAHDRYEEATLSHAE